MVTRGLELSVISSLASPPPCAHPQGEKGAWKLNQLPVANDLISHDYVMKLP